MKYTGKLKDFEYGRTTYDPCCGSRKNVIGEKIHPDFLEFLKRFNPQKRYRIIVEEIVE